MGAEEGAGPGPRVSPGADLVSALGWLALGAGLTIRARSHAWAALPGSGGEPSLVPAALGLLIALLGVCLLWRALRAAARGESAVPLRDERPVGGRRLAVAVALCGVYAGLLGRGLPFWLTSGGFVLLATLAFDWPARRASGHPRRGALLALAVALGSGLGLTLLFQEIFQVRLP